MRGKAPSQRGRLRCRFCLSQKLPPRSKPLRELRSGLSLAGWAEPAAEARRGERGRGEGELYAHARRGLFPRNALGGGETGKAWRKAALRLVFLCPGWRLEVRTRSVSPASQGGEVEVEGEEKKKKGDRTRAHFEPPSPEKAKGQEEAPERPLQAEEFYLVLFSRVKNNKITAGRVALAELQTNHGFEDVV